MLSSFNSNGSIFSMIKLGSSGSTLGTTWTQITTSALGYGQNALYVNNYLGGMATDISGNYILIGDENEAKVFLSVNAGTSWINLNSSYLSGIATGKGPKCLCMSNTGQYMYICLNANKLYKSSDYGNTWSIIDSSYSPVSICCSGDGSIIYSQNGANGIRKSIDYGNTFNQISTSILASNIQTKCINITMNRDNPNNFAFYCTSNTGAAAGQYGVYLSVNGASSFSNIGQTSTNITNIQVSNIGDVIISTYVGTNGLMYYTYSTSTWIGMPPATTAYTGTSPLVYSFSASTDFKIILAGNCYTSAYTYLLLSKDYGATWTRLDAFGKFTYQNVYVTPNGLNLFATGTSTKSDLYVSR